VCCKWTRYARLTTITGIQNHLILLIFRESGNVTSISEKRKYERRIYGLWKILSDNLGSKKWVTDLAGMLFQEPDQDIFSVDVTLTSKTEKVFCTFTAQSIRQPHLWNEIVKVTKAFPAKYLWILRRHDTFLYNLMWIKCVYLSPITFFALNKICFALRECYDSKDEHVSKYIPKSTKPLTSTFNKNVAELFNHVYNLWPQYYLLVHMVTRVHESSFKSNRKIHGIPVKVQCMVERYNGPWETRNCGAISGCDGVICSRLGSVGVFYIW
jgi:hypothetical protein